MTPGLATQGFGTFQRDGVAAPRLPLRRGGRRPRRRVARRLARAGPRCVGARDRRRNGGGREGGRGRTRRRRAGAAVHGRRLRRLLLLARARDQPRPDVPPRRGAAPPELASPAGRIPRPRGHGRRQRDGDPASARPGEITGRRRADVRPLAPARHRARARLRRRRAVPARRARPAGRLRRARLRRRARERLERARPAGVGVRPARPVPRQELRHLGVRLGHAARAARGEAGGRAAPGAGAAAAPPRHRRLGARRAARDRAERHRDLARQRQRPLLDDAAAARARDLERRERPHRRPDGLGHDLRARARQRREPDRADVERRAAARGWATAASAPSSRTATRSSCAASRSARSAAASSRLDGVAVAPLRRAAASRRAAHPRPPQRPLVAAPTSRRRRLPSGRRTPRSSYPRSRVDWERSRGCCGGSPSPTTRTRSGSRRSTSSSCSSPRGSRPRTDGGSVAPTSTGFASRTSGSAGSWRSIWRPSSTGRSRRRGRPGRDRDGSTRSVPGSSARSRAWATPSPGSSR